MSFPTSDLNGQAGMNDPPDPDPNDAAVLAGQRRIAAMCYGAVRPYYLANSGDGEHPAFRPWEELAQADRDQFTQTIRVRLQKLSSGGRLRSLAEHQHDPIGDFNLGLCAYVIDMVCQAVYDYTIARARANSQVDPRLRLFVDLMEGGQTDDHR